MSIFPSRYQWHSLENICRSFLALRFIAYELEYCHSLGIICCEYWCVCYISHFFLWFILSPVDNTAFAGSGKVGPVNQVHHTSWVAIVTSTDRPKSDRNRCVIELFVTFFAVSLSPYDISVGVWASVIGLSQISSFFSCSFILLKQRSC